MGERIRAAVKRVREAARRYGRSVWGRDLASLGGWAALWTRVARIATWSVRGVFKNKLSLQAAALAYYTIFAVVPVLVVVLWTLKLFHAISYLVPEAAALPAAENGGHAVSPNANALLREAARGILLAVEQRGDLSAGIIGLAALLYGVIRQVVHVEVALDTIAGARDRPPRYRRMLGYLALLALPPALLMVSGLLRMLSRLSVGSTLAAWIAWLFATIPLLRTALGAAVGLAILCVALAIFYASAARARIAFGSTMVGGLLGAVLLAAVFWAFALLQIGVARASTLHSGMAVVPVFLLWAFVSWLVILIGAQVAVAHELDRILVHGTSALHLDPYGEQMAGVQIMVETTRRALAHPGGGDGAATANELARELRLLPQDVRDVAGRLQSAGLLAQVNGGDYRLTCDPDRTHLRDVVGAVIGRPIDHESAPAGRTGPTLHELAHDVAHAK